jgi:hypothetical protein
MQSIILYKKIFHLTVTIIFISFLTIIYFVFINFYKDHLRIKDIIFFSSNLTDQTIDYQKFISIKNFSKTKKEDLIVYNETFKNPFAFDESSTQSQVPSDESSPPVE